MYVHPDLKSIIGSNIFTELAPRPIQSISPNVCDCVVVFICLSPRPALRIAGPEDITNFTG